MPRPLRSDLPDGIFHVTARGVAETDLFRDDDDRRWFLVFLHGATGRYDWLWHGFSLLSTHYHLLFETTRAQLSGGMQWLNGRYARTFNDRLSRPGHVFSERFTVRAVETPEHYASACDYILQNPVRAGLCERAEDWPWTRVRPRL